MLLLQDYAKQVWMLPEIEDKKLILKDMVMQFTFKKKQTQFLVLIESIVECSKLDKLASDITLAGAGLKIR